MSSVSYGVDNAGNTSQVAMGSDLATVELTQHQLTKQRYKMKSSTHLKKTCRICLRKHNGLHACLACVKFHRNKIMKNKPLKCVKTGVEFGTCKVSYRSTAPCEFCWSQRCLSSGLSKLSAKFNSRQYRRPILPARAPEVVRSVCRSYTSLFNAYDRRIKADYIKPLLLSDEPLEKEIAAYKASMFSQFCSFYQPLVNGMVSFSKKVPGFAELPPDDQLILLKTGFIDIWLILNSVRLTHVKDSITLYDGTQIPICEVTTIYTKEYVTSIMELSDESQTLKLTIPEKSLLISITLASPERPNLIEKEQVMLLQTSLMDTLKKYLEMAHPSDVERCEKVLAFLANVHDIGKQHSLLLNVYRADVGRLNVTPVITELFDLHPPSSYKEA